MKEEKIVEAVTSLGYELYKDDAEPTEIEGHNKYCVYYDHSLRKGDQLFFSKVFEFVFVNEEDGTFDEELIIPTIESVGLNFDSGDYGRLKKVVGGEVVNSLTLRFSCPRKKKVCNC